MIWMPITFTLGAIFGGALTYNIIKDAEIAKQAESFKYETRRNKNERK